MKNHRASIMFVLMISSLTSLFAKGAGTTSGLTLAEAPGARSMGLAEAFSGVSNDITGFGYNPASIQSLKTGQASFFYRTGMTDDSYGQFMIGSPIEEGSVGLSVGYFNGGMVNLNDGTVQRTVTVQRDLSIGLGYSHGFGNLDLGFKGKYLSSEIAELQSASAFALDAGLQYPLNPRFRLGASIQNFGTKLKYKNEADNLPRTARAGFAYQIIPGASALQLTVDVIDDLNNPSLLPTFGLEKLFGPLAIRAGYKHDHGLGKFSIGTGFTMSQFSLDYSFNLVDQLSSQHLVSLSTRFDSFFIKEKYSRQKNDSPKKPNYPVKIDSRKVQELNLDSQTQVIPQPLPELKGEETRHRIYTVREGDTLETIAQQVYGKRYLWTLIFNANRHLLNDPKNIQAGQKILVPASHY